MKILEELKVRVSNDMIAYSDEENKDKKERKLKLVVGEYLTKYEKEMQGQRCHIMLPHLEDALRRYLHECESSQSLDLNKNYICMLFTSIYDRYIQASKKFPLCIIF